MDKIDDYHDMRIKILAHLFYGDFGLEHDCINSFLADLKTSYGNGDVGSIRRSLQDLLKAEMILETNYSEFIITTGEEMKTRGKKPRDEWNNSIRFVKELKNAPRIPDIHLGITLKGIEFLRRLDHDAINTETNLNIQETNIGHTTLITKQRKTHNWIVGATIAMAVGAIGTIVLALIPNRESKALDQIDFQLQKIQNETSTPHYHEGSLIYIHDTIYVDSVILENSIN